MGHFGEALVGALLLVAAAGAAQAESPARVNPAFPRIANCYGAGLSWRSWDEGKAYWPKLDLIIGGGYDLHYDWDAPHWPQALARMEANVRRLREANPHVLVLPYVDVIEGPDNPALPKHWWSLNDRGERWSGWPGYFRINTDLPEVLQYNLDRVRQEVFGRDWFDGVFYDCWYPDPWLVPRTAALRDGRAIVMVNAWNLPSKGIETLNGALAEDEINRVIEGKVEFEDFLGRYLRWCRDSRKPAVTTIVCHPRGIDDDPWRWSRMTHEQRVAVQEKARAEDQQTMRFGLATTLMGDGYFGYDCGTMGRGNWWWYPEYDAPLGYPRGPARRNRDGTWQRDFTGGTVVVNGTLYDAAVRFPRPHRDVSTGRVGTRFTVPMLDGRIFLPAQEAPTRTPDAAPRLTVRPPAQVCTVPLDGGMVAARSPSGLELRVEAAGAIRHILWRGQPLMSGGFPVALGPANSFFRVEGASGGSVEGEPGGSEVRLRYEGELVEGGQRARYIETCTLARQSRFTVRFDMEALTDLDLRFWRHYFAFPVARYAGGMVRAGGKEVALPEAMTEGVLASGKEVTVAAKGVRVTVASSVPLTLVDHRKWGTEEYLLAGYPVGSQVKQGTRWSVQMTVSVSGQ